jgi:hypothetical protein
MPQFLDPPAQLGEQLVAFDGYVGAVVNIVHVPAETIPESILDAFLAAGNKPVPAYDRITIEDSGRLYEASERFFVRPDRIEQGFVFVETAEKLPESGEFCDESDLDNIFPGGK